MSPIGLFLYIVCAGLGLVVVAVIATVAFFFVRGALESSRKEAR